MFLDFYQLREQPFVVTPDARFLYLSATHGEALASLIYGVECDRGFLALIAAPGMGKTTLVFRLLEHLGNDVRSAFLLQPEDSALDVLRALVLDLEIETACRDAFAMKRELTKLLVAEAERGRRVLVVIDEAQDWSDDVLESVRLLSNFETPARKLIQFVLIGQPALAKRLLHPSLVQLRQRISITARLEPFTAEETDDYIDHRLAVAGYAGGELFDREARASIARIGEGIPRNINNLCFNALSLGCAIRSRVIGAAIIREVAADLNFASLAGVTLRPAPVPDAGNKFGTVAAPEAVEWATNTGVAERGRMKG